ncbi:MAG: endonuclease/exonuclease/phosphatase family protein [Anaerolineales bacterium]
MRRFLITCTLLLLLVAACGNPQTTATPAASPATVLADTPQPSPSPTPNAAPTVTPTLSTYQDFLPRPSEGSLRVLSYNVNWDSIFPDDDPQNHDLRAFNRVEAFKRILRALQPDVICLQEINYLRSSEQIGVLVADALGSDEAWYAAKERDTFIVSRFPLEQDGYELVVTGVVNALQQAAALVDLPDAVYGNTDLYLICAHFKAGGTTSDILLRQEQADVIMAHIQDALSPGENLDLAAETPYLLVGDFNIYDTDPHNHLWTMLRGDIYNERRYGNDFAPDWDVTTLSDAAPNHNGLGKEGYTWRDDASSFPPGSFDRILYTDSVLRLENTFVLNTTLLAPEVLSAWGMMADDVLLAGEAGVYDHLPVVADFEILP